MPRYIEKAETLTLPAIALRGIVAFPSIPVSCELERDMSKKAAKAALDSSMMVFMVPQKDIDCEEPGQDDLYEVGCVAKISNSLAKSGNDTVRITVEGYCRASLIELRNENGCLWADVLCKTVTADFSVKDIKTEATIKELIDVLSEMTRFMPRYADDFMRAVKGMENPGMIADFIAANAFVRYQDKAAVLAEFDPFRRAERCMVLMESEVKLLQTQLDIQIKVKQAMDDNQRDYFLREQIRAIENELGIDSDEQELQKRLDAAELPDEVRSRLGKEILKLAKTPQGSPDSAVIRNYIETCLDIPWGKKTKDRLNIVQAKKILDGDHDGLTKIKDRILEFLAVKQLNPELKNQILCFVGPPGTGKTSLGASIATALNRKYVRVSLGGVRDESDIRGHRKTYIGSMPGRIITALTQCGSMNPVMLLDEVDKMCSDMRGDPASALLEVLDSEQNKAFRDHFIELPVDLSDILFITTANTLDTVPRPLLDRMEVLELNTYTPGEKLQIAKNHLVPKQIKRHGLTKKSFRLTDDAINELIAGYTRESGVRNLERDISSLCRKAAKRMIEEGLKSVKITAGDLEGYLGPRKIIDDPIGDLDLVGVTNGMAYTDVGGDLLKVEVLPVEGTGKIELTGTLGDVMKESAHIAVTYTRAHCSEYGIPADFYKTMDIHIHVPEGATPKDGPSAGVTMCTSLISALSGLKVRHDIAMTGEITLTGRVLPIGGLREKATAAYSAGVRTILIPKENMRDIRELDAEVAGAVTFIPCSSLDDVLSFALVKPAKAAEVHPVLPVMDENPIIAEIKDEKIDAPYVKYPPRRKRPYSNSNQ